MEVEKDDTPFSGRQHLVAGTELCKLHWYLIYIGTAHYCCGLLSLLFFILHTQELFFLSFQPQMFHILEVCFGESVTEYITNRLDRTKDMSLDVVSLYVLRQMIKVGLGLG